MARKQKYTAVYTVHGRTHHSILTKSQKIINFESSKEPNSELEQKINSYISSNPGIRITEIKINYFARIAEEIIPEKTTYETHLKQMYDSVD